MDEWIERIADDVMGGLLSKQVNRFELVEALRRVQNETPVSGETGHLEPKTDAVMDESDHTFSRYFGGFP